MAESDQAPTLRVRGGAICKQHLGVRRVAIQGEGVLEHDAHRVRESIRHVPRDQGDTEPEVVGGNGIRATAAAIYTVRPRRVTGLTEAVTEARR
jgi:hypothetical protein